MLIFLHFIFSLSNFDILNCQFWQFELSVLTTSLSLNPCKYYYLQNITLYLYLYPAPLSIAGGKPPTPPAFFASEAEGCFSPAVGVGQGGGKAPSCKVDGGDFLRKSLAFVTLPTRRANDNLLANCGVSPHLRCWFGERSGKTTPFTSKKSQTSVASAERPKGAELIRKVSKFGVKLIRLVLKFELEVLTDWYLRYQNRWWNHGRGDFCLVKLYPFAQGILSRVAKPSAPLTSLRLALD